MSLFKFEWEAILREWSKAQISQFNVLQRDSLPAEVWDSQWLGYARATVEQICAAEERLSTTLPNSYRKFLMASNGWRLLSTIQWPELLPVEDVNWFRVLNETYMGACIQGAINIQDFRNANYPNGDWEEDQDHPTIPPADYRAALQISTNNETTILLNPNVRTKKGEWEVLKLTSDYTARYKSFRKFMMVEFKFVRAYCG